MPARPQLERFDGMAGMFLKARDFMKGITIRAAQPAEYDEIARVWMDSWVSIGLQLV
jgi:hypothetical protein